MTLNSSSFNVRILIAGIILVTGLCTAMRAQNIDIQTVYATKKGACGTGAKVSVEITQGKITGPGFACEFSNGRPAGTGLVAYDAACLVDGKKSSTGIALDLGNYDDHFELSLPGRATWLSLYPCTPVPGLK